jgi:serine/threonine-protein kinase
MLKPAILLIDDEERILRSLRMLFQSTYTVHMTTDPAEAIRLLREEKIHVFISDQRMPLMQGSELLRIAKETSPATMRILLTGYSDLNASIASVNDGEVFRYLLKPWDVDDVKNVVAEACAIAEASYAVRFADSRVAERGVPRVLIIDSDESTVIHVRDILKERCEIVWANTAQMAMEELGKQDVSVVVSELMLEGNNISYILKTIKQLNPSTQCIVITSFQDSARLIDLINQAQISRYLPKPVVKNLLAHNLESMLERFNLLGSHPSLKTRQSVAPITDEREKLQSSNFMSLISRLRAKVMA